MGKRLKRCVWMHSFPPDVFMEINGQLTAELGGTGRKECCCDAG